MAKESNFSPSSEAVASQEMIRAVKSEIAKFKDYEAFLVSVWAKKENGNVNQFPNADMNKYEEKFVDRFCKYGSINDSFIFSKFAKRTKFNEEKKIEEPTGWFMPITFWNFIRNSN